jgi:hypothetical protein
MFDARIEFRLAEGHPYQIEGKPWVGGQEVVKHFFMRAGPSGTVGASCWATSRMPTARLSSNAALCGGLQNLRAERSMPRCVMSGG